jgi:cytochrome c-type biogenesis protein CcmH/NrfF
MLIGSLVLLSLLASPETPAQQRARIERLEDAILAPCCYAEPISRHQSEIAIQMRLQIAQWVAQGRSDQDILHSYTKLYGAKVLVDPATAPREWMYLVPWIALALGGMLAAWLLKRWRNAPSISVPAADGPVAQIAEIPDLDED